MRSKSKSDGRRRASSASSSDSAALQAFLANVVECSNDAIYTRKLDATIVSWNPAAERIFGYTEEEMIGRSSQVLLPSDRLNETSRILDRIRRGMRVDHFETIRVTKDGRRLNVFLSVSPIRDRRGRITGASTIARDITAERQLEAALLEISEQERQRMGRDLHDGLGQQLGGVELLCRTLAKKLARRGIPESSTADLLVKQIQAATRQTRSLARGLTPVMDNPNGLMLTLENFATTTRTLFRVNCTFDCNEPVLIPDHSAAIHLFRIAQEAVANSIRHGRARRIVITLQKKIANITLEIRDNGRGMTPSNQGTTGIGLRIMKYRAASLGGSLRISNTPQRGVTVTCTVPITQINSGPVAP